MHRHVKLSLQKVNTMNNNHTIKQKINLRKSIVRNSYRNWQNFDISMSTLFLTNINIYSSYNY